MNKDVVVLIARGFGPESNHSIAGVDARVQVIDVSDGTPIGPGYRKDELLSLNQISYRGAPAGDPKAIVELKQNLARAEVMLGTVVVSDLLPHMPRLKWIQLVSAGIDYLDGTGLLESDVMLTTARGCFDIPLSEYALGAMLLHAKGVLRFLENKQRHAWERSTPTQLNGKRLGILGLGSVGSEVARRATGFNLHRCAFDPYVSEEHADGLGVGLVGLDELLGTSDYVVITLPLTQETRHIIGAAELNRMPRHAFLVNISRGNIIDEQALIDSLRNNRIAGAALDVFEQEPLPAESPLWDLPNVYLSPHIAAGSDQHAVRVTELFCKNLNRYLLGEELINVLDKKRGY